MVYKVLIKTESNYIHPKMVGYREIRDSFDAGYIIGSYKRDRENSVGFS